MSEYYIIHSDDELHHHGIKGMHWGVRRYQNEDGSLTEAGKRRIKRLDNTMAKYAKRIEKRSNRIRNREESFNNSKRKQKLLIKKAKNEQKYESVKGKNQVIRDKRQLYGKQPGFFDRRRLNKEWRAKKRLDRVNKALMKPEIKNQKDAFRNFKDLDRINSANWKKQVLKGQAYGRRKR